MAAPTVVNVGTCVPATTAITPTLPASLQADDIMIGIAESVGGEVYPSMPPSGWAHVLGSPINVDTSTRLTVIWRRFVGGDTALSWGDSGNHNAGQIIGIRGVKTSGDPWNVAPTTSQETAANNSAEWPSVTTNIADCLIILAIATGRDLGTTANLGAVTNGALTSITERMDTWTALGTGGGIGMATGIKAAAGVVGTSTATMGSTDSKALMTIALEPVVAAALPPLAMVTAPFDPDTGRVV